VPRAAVDEQPQERMVAPVGEAPPALARGEQAPQLRDGQHRDGLPGTAGARILAMGLDAISSSSCSHLYHCCSAR
jgi:hypothetical protein